jgi:hypothetical protein
VTAVKSVKDINDKEHVSITGRFQQFAKDGFRSGAKEFSLNIRLDENKEMFDEMKAISLLEEKSDVRKAAIDKFNSFKTEINYASEMIPLYFVYDVVAGKAVIQHYKANHPRLPNQPYVGKRIVEYWLAADNAMTADERIQAKIKQIGNMSMFVNANTAVDELQLAPVGSDIRKLMDKAIENDSADNSAEDVIVVKDKPATDEKESEKKKADAKV